MSTIVKFLISVSQDGDIYHEVTVNSWNIKIAMGDSFINLANPVREQVGRYFLTEDEIIFKVSIQFVLFC